jgi:hypothetical protein
MVVGDGSKARTTWFLAFQKGVSVMALIPLDLRQGGCIFGKSGHWHNAFRGKALSGRTVNFGAILIHRYSVKLGEGYRTFTAKSPRPPRRQIFCGRGRQKSGHGVPYP